MPARSAPVLNVAGAALLGTVGLGELVGEVEICTEGAGELVGEGVLSGRGGLCEAQALRKIKNSPSRMNCKAFPFVVLLIKSLADKLSSAKRCNARRRIILPTYVSSLIGVHSEIGVVIGDLIVFYSQAVFAIQHFASARFGCPGEGTQIILNGGAGNCKTRIR